MIRLGISTCPNDTFAFHGLMNQKVDLQGLQFEIELLDIQELNQRILDGSFEVAKASFALAHQVAESWVVLPSGSALGFGVGPLLLASKAGTQPHSETQTTLCPGEHTTATLLFKMFHGQTQLEQTVFSKVMPALQNGKADFGVCIHEGRFTYAQSGLFLVEDLGTRWEQDTGCPLPLGGILARRELGTESIARIQSVVRSSVEYGLKHRNETLPTMRQHAQEFSDEVLMKHVDLYVNDWTVDLGDVGCSALKKMSELCNHATSNVGGKSIEVFGKRSR